MNEEFPHLEEDFEEDYQKITHQFTPLEKRYDELSQVFWHGKESRLSMKDFVSAPNEIDKFLADKLSRFEDRRVALRMEYFAHYNCIPLWVKRYISPVRTVNLQPILFSFS